MSLIRYIRLDSKDWLYVKFAAGFVIGFLLWFTVWQPLWGTAVRTLNLSSLQTESYGAREKETVKVLPIVTPAPPIITFPHHNLESFFKVSIAHAHRPGRSEL